jgi:RNA polymerase sigma-54 factor
MKLQLSQKPQLSQKLAITPRLQMAIKFLQLNQIELTETIEQELENNPALEIQEPGDDFEKEIESDKTDQTIEEVQIKEDISNDVDWSNYIDEYNSAGKIHFQAEHKNAPDFESFIAPKKSLNEHLLWQLLMTSPTRQEESIGSLIAGNLNQNGYLDVPLEDIAKSSEFSYEELEQVLLRMQSFDPIGICARNLRECLMIQARHFNINNVPVTDIIKNHLNNLQNGNYRAISRALKTSMKKVIAAVNIIKGFEPKPGREFAYEQPQYIVPDIFVYKVENDFVILMNDDGTPNLHLNSFYKNSVKNNTKLSDSTRDYVQEKMRSAQWLIRCVHQRRKTIYRVMESVLQFQKDFFTKGVQHLKPMVLKDVALDLSMHESTISRAVSNKYAHTPLGIFELKYFFSSSVNNKGEAVASASIRDKIQQIIQNEDPKKPFCDEKIAEILKSQNINIARRTVAKYRDIMKILSSNKRRQRQEVIICKHL